MAVLENASSTAVSHFEFGANWRQYLKKLTPERIDSAKSSLLEFVGEDAIEGKSFLDVGCGSGLFSYAAHELGAAKVTSFDIDPESVECCKALRAKAGNPENWTVLQGSVLDDTFTERLAAFDLVYSWGVLHHTGEMWRAIRSAARLVQVEGLFYIAIYNKVKSTFGSEFWLKVKKRYNSSSRRGKTAMEVSFLAYYYAMDLGGRALSVARRQKQTARPRGMELRTDVIDWIGGYPYEFASPDEMKSFMLREFPFFTLVRVVETPALGNNSFLWRNDTRVAS